MKPRLPVPAVPVPGHSVHADAYAFASPAGRRTVDSGILFDGGNELVILHRGESYRLRNTRQGKLILTK